MQDLTSGVVLRALNGGVLLITLNRPAVGNAWSGEMSDLYFDSLDEANKDVEVRAIVVTGAGRSFCVGADVSAIQDDYTPSTPRSMTFPLTVEKPIIAAINGGCAGVGLVQALMCDIRFCAPAAKLTTAFVRRGLVAEHGIAWLLPRLIGPARALDLLLSGRVIVGAEAATFGLVNAISDDPVAEALAYGRELATWCSPASMAVIKGQVYRQLDLDIDASLKESDRLTAESLTRADVTDGVASFLEKRPPAFDGHSG